MAHGKSLRKGRSSRTKHTKSISGVVIQKLYKEIPTKGSTPSPPDLSAFPYTHNNIILFIIRYHFIGSGMGYIV